MSNRKLAVMFPGIGYHNEKPLLYYTGKLLAQLGFEVIRVSYKFPEAANSIKDNKEKMQDAFYTALNQANEQLSGILFEKYDTILFIGKSIGTTVAGYYDNEHDINARQIVLTPVPRTFDFLKNESGIVFHGLSDPWCDSDIVKEKCCELELQLYTFEGANHSLETGDTMVDIHTLERVIEIIEEYVRAINA